MKIVAICVLAFSLIGVLQARPKISDRETEMEEIDLLALMENMEAEEEQEDSYDELLDEDAEIEEEDLLDLLDTAVEEDLDDDDEELLDLEEAIIQRRRKPAKPRGAKHNFCRETRAKCAKYFNIKWAVTSEELESEEQAQIEEASEWNALFQRNSANNKAKRRRMCQRCKSYMNKSHG